MVQRVAGVEPGQRHLNGPQTTGREYRNLSEASYDMVRDDDAAVPTRDGTVLRADVYRPAVDGRFPALVAASCYPRQIQDLGAPMGFIEAGASDFFVPRGYVHVIANVRGTGQSAGTYSFLDHTERQDLHDLVEWVAAQPWCDGNVGMIGISYYAMAQLEAAVERPPHLKAIFPVATTADPYEIVWHHGLLNANFITAWVSAVAVMAGHDAALWRGTTLDALRRVVAAPRVHKRFEHMNGESAVSTMKLVMRLHYDPHPWDDLRWAACVEHPVHDAFWDERNLLPLLTDVDIPVYLGCDWENTPVHLPSTFTVLAALRRNPHVRVGLLGAFGMTWPWESLHVEALAWFDHWLKGADTGITEGAPIRYWLSGADEWRTADTWPPAGATLHDYALRVDGTLDPDEGAPGSRAYLSLTAAFDRPADVNPPDLPPMLQWDTPPLDANVEMVGDLELDLDATLSASDAGWIAILLDVSADGTTQAITTGWLRATLRTVNEAASRPGAPVLDCREPVAVPPNQLVSYRLPLVPNAHRFNAGHRIRLLVCSDDEPDDVPAMLGFRHPPVTPAVRASIASSSRLRLPVLAVAAC